MPHLTAEQILLVLDTAEPFKEVSERKIKKVPTLRGKTIVNLFYEFADVASLMIKFDDEWNWWRHFISVI